MANEFVIKNGYFSQGNSNVTGSLQVTGSVGVTGSVSITQNVTASKALFSSSNGNQLTVIGSGSTLAQVYGSQGNLLTVNDTFSGSIFTVTDVSGYPILDITSDYYTSTIQMIGTASLTGSLSITENLTVGQNLTASKALISSSGNEQLMVMGSGSSSWITGIYGSQGNLLTVTDTFSGSLFTISDISGYPILDVISNTSIGDSVQIIGTSSLTGSLFVNQNGNTPFQIDNNLINFYVTESKYWEVADRATSDRLFRMQYQTTPTEGVLVQIGGISDSDTVLTVDQTAQTININALTASILQLTNVPQTNVVTIDTNTGQLFYTASSAIGGGGSGTPGGLNKQVQFNRLGGFSGSSNFTFDSASNTVEISGSLTVSGSGTFTNIGPAQFTGSVGVSGSLTITGSLNTTQGGLTGSLFGTASYVSGSVFTSANPALSASYALTASHALNGGAGVSSLTVGTGLSGSSTTGNITLNLSATAYTTYANNTAATATPSLVTFKEVGEQAMVATITWNGTPPGGTTNLRYRWFQIGNMVQYFFFFNYGTAGLTNSTITFDFPSDMPTPTPPTGTGTASTYIYRGSGLGQTLPTAPSTAANSSFWGGGIRRDSGNTKYEFFFSVGSAITARAFYHSGFYFV